MKRAAPHFGPPRHSPAGAVPTAEQATEAQILETGIKVVDLLAPYAKGGKIGLFRRRRRRKTVLIMELIQQRRQGARGLFRCSPASVSAPREGNDLYHEMIEAASTRRVAEQAPNALWSMAR